MIDMKKVIEMNVIMDDIVGNLDDALCKNKTVNGTYIKKVVIATLKKYGINISVEKQMELVKKIGSYYGINIVVKKHTTSTKKSKNNDNIAKYGKPSKRQQQQIDAALKKYDEQTSMKKQIVKKQNTKYDHVCYRFLTFAGEVIYVGRAENLVNRLESHAKSGHLSALCYNRVDKVEFCTFESEDDLDIAERYYIAKYQPEYNVVFKNKKYFLISELDNKQWKEYSAGARILKNR